LFHLNLKVHSSSNLIFRRDARIINESSPFALDDNHSIHTGVKFIPQLLYRLLSAIAANHNQTLAFAADMLRVWRSGAPPRTTMWGTSGQCPTPERTKRPTFNTVIYLAP